MGKLVSIFILFSVPLLTQAAGLVPCDGTKDNPCGFCQVGQLVKNITDWLAVILGIVVVLIIIGGGLQMVLSVGNVSAKTTARKLIASALVGYVIFLAAWMIVDTFLKFLIPGSSYGVANPLMC